MGLEAPRAVRPQFAKEQERMKAGQRLGMVIGAAALALAAAPVRAQTAPPPPAEQPPESGAIGPRELQNFSIDGTVTRPAEQPSAQPPAASPPARTPSAQGTAPRSGAPAPAATERVAEAPAGQPEPASSQPPGPAPARTAAESLTAPGGSVTVPLPPLDGRVSGSDLASATDEAGLSPGSGFTAWPWLLAAIALALGGLFLWRSRSRHALAGYAVGPQVDALVAPDLPSPAPAPRPRSTQPAAPPVAAPPPAGPAPFGVVSTRLRPKLELEFTPLRCVVDDDRVTVDFELGLTNNGSAPARAVLIEASMFNAGPAQDQAIGAFFANPVAKGERIAAIAPLKRIAVRSQVVAPRANVQLFKVEGREMLIPLIAFNALYGWSGGEAQSSSAYLLGRDVHSEKLAPLRADLGARQFVDLGSRPLPNEVRS